MAAVLCYPYGVSITCVCDNSGSVYNCYPTNYKNKHSAHINNSPLQVRDQRALSVDWRLYSRVSVGAVPLLWLRVRGDSTLVWSPWL